MKPSAASRPSPYRQVLALIIMLAILGARVGPVETAGRDAPSQETPTAQPIVDAIADACRTYDPYFLTALQWRTDNGRYEADAPALVAFNFGLDGPAERRVLARQTQVGTVYGLAYDPIRRVVYAAAYHKRAAAFGPGGPGAIYAVDLASGSVSTFVKLPAGTDQHDFRAEDDRPAMTWVSRSSLGDIDLDAGAATLFASNMADGRIYRVDTATAAILGSFAHGASATDWRRNARLMGLAWREGWLYHGVVDTRELEGQPGSLRAVVYRSRADGGEMSEWASLPLDYPRKPAAWSSWAGATNQIVWDDFSGGYRVGLSGALLADIAFDADGSLIAGLRDRTADLAPSLHRWPTNDFGVGDLIRMIADPVSGWMLADPDFFDDLPSGGVDEATMGGLASLAGLEQTISSSVSVLTRTDVGALRFFDSSGDEHAATQLHVLGEASEQEIGPNGMADVELLCPPDTGVLAEVAATATAAIATATSAAAATGTAIALFPTSSAPPTPEDFDRVVADACTGPYPYGATVCFPSHFYGYNDASIIGYRDTPADSPSYALAYAAQIGTVWGLAYAGEAHTLYAAAFLKRGVRFGPSGPGAVYSIEIPSGTVRTFAQVPDAGHDPHVKNIWSDDQRTQRFVGELSLGDLDLSSDERELFVVNLYDRRIHRYSTMDGRALGSFAHGASSEVWALDARPFGLKFHADRLYHGLVDSAIGSGDRQRLAAYVYSSQADGGEMRLEARIDLRYDRGQARVPGTVQFPGPQQVSLDWQAWVDRYANMAAGRAQMAVYPQPQLTDIEFDDDGNMVLGLHDRMTDMSSSNPFGEQLEKPALGLGDLIFVPRRGSGWDGAAADPERFGQVPGSDARRSHVGGLARLKAADLLMANFMSLLPAGAAPVPGQGSISNLFPGMAWYDAAGNVLSTEQVCLNPLVDPKLPFLPTPSAVGITEPMSLGGSDLPAALDHSEWTPGRGMGDVELLCGPTSTPPPTPIVSPTPSATPTQTATATRTRTPSPSPTATRTSIATPSPLPTRDSRVIYLPLMVAERCDPARQRIDVVLVIDASTSMRTPTRAGRPKIDAASSAAAGFIERLALPEDQAALVAFNAEATVLSRLSGDRAALLRALGTLQTKELTRIHRGMDLARELVLAREHRDANLPAIVLLTDGRSNPDPGQLAVDAAAAAKAAGIRVFTVGLGEDVEPEVLRAMASRPEDFFQAGDGEDLAAIYQAIAVALPCPIAAWWPSAP